MQEKEIQRLFKTAYGAFEDYYEGVDSGIESQSLREFTLAVSGLISSLPEDEIENTILHAAALYFLIFVYSGLDEKNYLKITDRADSEVREEFREYEHFRSEAEKVLKGIIPPGKDAAAIVNKYSAVNEIRFREAYYSGSQLLGYYSKLDYKGNTRKNTFL